ncbi:2-acylglycerol O-acyltransferase 2-A-like [Watersipora subatra]|uniref:2-acylglycerol O-acyltransferase 2-A-like n=1 Tax=Watersipora subatra TaxID=2589382 RepID=UPI00355B275D
MSEIGHKMLGIHFAPLKVPLKRRIEMLAVVQWVICYLFVGAACTILSIWLFFTSLWPAMILYTSWYIYDRRTPCEGGRRSQLVRHSALWKHFANYFPLKLVKEVDLDPNQNYILGCHPHGIFSTSHFANFATEATGFSALFPNIVPHLMVLDGGFRFPLFREYFMMAGFCSSKKSSLEYLMTKETGGNAACVVVGGAIESLEAKSGNFRLILANKKGFIKSALRTGASLVPVYSFGENDLYSQVTNDKMVRLQKWLTKKMGFTVPLAYGRGIFNYSFGILPQRKPVDSIVGVPIPVTKKENPSQEDIDNLHALYMQGLHDLFERHKHTYSIPPTVHLELI